MTISDEIPAGYSEGQVAGLARLQIESRCLSALADHLSYALAACDAQGRLAHATQPLLDWVDATTPVTLELGCLRLRQPRAQRLFDRALRSSVEDPGSGPSLLPIGMSAGAPVSLRVEPLGSAPWEPGRPSSTQPRLALVTITVHRPREAVDPRTLRELLGLTATEAEIARRLADDCSPTEIAGLLGVGLSTVRGHLRSIYFKTGCNRQSSLVRLVLSLQVR